MMLCWAVSTARTVPQAPDSIRPVVGLKSSGRSLNDAPSPKSGASALRRVPTKAEVYGGSGVTGQSEATPSVAPVKAARAADEPRDGSPKAQALLIFSDTRKASNCIIELPTVPGAVGAFDVVADKVPPMPYKNYGEKVVCGVAFNGSFMASTFCDMLYCQTNSVYTASDWTHQYNYDYRAADLEVTALGYNPLDGMCYGAFQGTNPASGNEEWFFGKWVDPSSYTRPEVISWIGADTVWYGVAISPKGVIYAIDGDGNLLNVDAATGETVLIGNTGLQNQYKTSACYDADNDRILFATSLDSGSSMNAIDPATGRATMLYMMPDGEQIVGLFIPDEPTPDKAPSPATNLKADFALGSLSGNICFDVPATYSDGTPASGKVDYEVRLNGEEKGTGKADYGTTVSVAVDLEESLNGLVSVRLWNENGSTPSTRATLFCGTPAPRPPYFNDKLVYDETEKCFNLSWEPNRDTSGVTGGSVVNADLSYELVRYPDGKIITTAPGVTTLSDPFEPDGDNVTVVYYDLRAVYHGVKSRDVRSNPMKFGVIVPPFLDETMNSMSTALYSFMPTASDALEWSYIGPVTQQNVQHGWMYHGAANSKTPMDSYLVLSAMQLQKDKVYTLAFTAACTNTSWRNERLGVYLGKEISETGLRMQTLIEPTLIYSRREEDGERLSCNFSVAEDGLYYLSFHHCSDPDLRYLYIAEVSVSAPVDGAVPQEVSDLEVKAAADGELSASLRFTMPTKSVDGKALAEPTKIRIMRGEEQIADLEPKGTTCNYVDRNAVNGINNYVVIPYNSKGDGLKAAVNVFVGVGKPLNPQPRAWYGGDDGTALIKWTPPAADEFGTALNNENTRFEIQRVTEEDGKTVRTVIAENVEGLQYEDHYCDANAPLKAVSYYVRAVTAGGWSQWVSTHRVCLGVPQTAPWSDSFADGKADYEWFSAGQNVRWGPVNDEVYDDAKSVDADNGFMICVAAQAETPTLLYSVPVVIPADMQRPEFSFYFFNQDKYHGTPVKNFVELVIIDENSHKYLKKQVCDGPWGWERLSYSLDEYRGKKIQVGVYAECIDRPSVLVDAFRVASRLDNDIDMVTLRGPGEIEVGEEATLTVSFENLGVNDVTGDCMVELYRNDEKIGEQKVAALRTDEKGDVNFTVKTNPTMTSTMHFKAVVVYDKDENTANNVSNIWPVKLISNDGYPAPENLTSAEESGNIALKWEAPDMTRIPRQTYTEDFEQFDSFAKSIPGWTILDEDKGIVAPISNYIQTPDTWGSPFGFFVQDRSVAPFSEYEEFTPFSGNKYMASQFVTDGQGNGIANDDWLISPELSGDRQIASFMGKSISSSWPESFEVYYSMDGTDVSDFQLIGGVAGAPDSWIHYTAEIPEGARYFAIRCVSYSCLQFMVDDVTLRLKSCDPIVLTHQGYNVYRDGVLVNEVPVSALEYVDSAAPAGRHTYKVTAVYKEGESNPSNASVILGVASPTQESLAISGGRGFIHIVGAEGMRVSVCDVAGITVCDRVLDAENRINVPSGVYVVTVGRESRKVMVR